MKSNKTKYIVVGVLVVGAAGVLMNDMLSSPTNNHRGNSSSNNEVQSGVITQNVIKETVITEKPKTIEIAPIPTLGAEDIEYMNNLREEEKLRHRQEVATLNAQIAKLEAQEKESKASTSSSAELRSITGGSSPASLSKVSSLNIGVNETSVVPKGTSNSNKQNSRKYAMQQAFQNIEIASMSTNESGTDVWISQNGNLYHASMGYTFNGFIVKEITSNYVQLVQLSSGFDKTFQLTTINMPEKKLVENDITTTPKANSVSSIKKSLKSIRKG